MDFNNLIEMILKYLNIGLIILFIGLIIFFVINGLLGLKRGIFKTTYWMLFYLVSFLLLIFLLDPICKIVSDFPINKWIESVTITSTDGTKSYTVAATTIGETLKQSLKAVYLIFNMSGSLTDATNFAFALSMSIVRFVVFLIGSSLIFSLFTFFAWLAWVFGFRKLTPKIVKKRIKFKWIAFAEGMLTSIMCVFISAAPTFSIINLVTQSYKNNNPNYATRSEEELTTIDRFIKTYDESVFAQVFFNWTTNDDNFTLDTAFMEWVTTSTVEDIEYSFIDTISDLLETSSALLDSVTFKDGQFVFDSSIALNSTAVLNVFESLSESSLITAILPIALEFAGNIEEVKSVIDLGSLNTDDIDWSKEIDNLGDIYEGLLDIGVVELLINNDFNNFNVKDYILSLLEEEKIEEVKSILKTLDSSNLISNAIAIMVSNLSTISPEVGRFFDTDINSLLDIEWGFELSTLADTLYRINSVDPEMIDLIIPNTSTTKVKKAAEGDKTDTDLLIRIIDHIDDYEDILLGDVSEVDSQGRTIVYENGEKVDGRYYHLFDLQLAKNILNNLDDTLINLFASNGAFVIDPEAVYSVVDQLNSGAWRMNYKMEFSSIFDSLEPLVKNGTLTTLIEEGFPTDFTSIDSNLIESLTQALPLMDDSLLVSTLVYDSIIDMINTEDTRSQFASFGLDEECFDRINEGMLSAVEEGNFGEQMAPIVRRIGDINSLVTALEDPNQIIEKLGDYTEEKLNQRVCILLDTIYNSNILNYYENESEKDKNYFTLMNYVLSQINQDGLSFFDGDYATFIEETRDISWTSGIENIDDFPLNGNGEPIYTGENGMICSIIIHIARSNLLNELTTSGFLSDNANFLRLAAPLDEAGLDLPGLLTRVNESAVFSYTIGQLLDQYLSGSLVDKEIGVSFSNVTDWDKEGQKLKDILTILGNQSDLNFESLDITKIKDVVALNNLLHDLAKSKIFEDRNNNEYKFGEWLYDKVSKAFSDPSTSQYNLIKDPTNWDESWGEREVLDDNGNSSTIFRKDMIYSDGTNRSTYADFVTGGEGSELYYINEYHEFNVDKYTSPYYEDPEFLIDYQEVFEVDELSKITAVFFHASSLMKEEADFENISRDDLENILYSVNNTKVLRMAVYNIYEIAKDALGDTSEDSFFDLSSSYTSYLIDCDTGLFNYDQGRTSREDELNVLLDLFSLFKNMKEGYPGEGPILSNSGINIENISDEFIDEAEDAFTSMSSSKVFHFKDPNSLGDEKTVFQSLIYSLIETTPIMDYFYNENNPKDYINGWIDEETAKEKLDDVIKKTFDFNNGGDPSNEIGKIMDVIRNALSFFKDGDLDLNNIGDLNIDDVRELLESFLESGLLYDCVPNAVYKLCGSIDLANGIDNADIYLDLKDSNIFYHYFNIVDNKISSINWEAKYSTNDMDTLITLYEAVQKYQNDDPSSPIPKSFTSLEQFKSIDGDISPSLQGFEDLLKNLESSNIFHRSGLKVDYTSGVYEGDDVTYSNSYTLVQEIFLQVLKSSELHKFIYLGEDSPKDIQFKADGVYVDLNEKIEWLVSDVFNFTSETSGQDEIENIASCFSSLADLGSTEFDNVGFIDTLDTSLITNVFSSFNQSNLLYDCVPNIIHMLFNEMSFDSFSSEGEVPMVNFTKATCFYHYKNSDSTFTYTNRFEEEEISNLKEIIDSYKDINTVLKVDGSYTSIFNLGIINDLFEKEVGEDESRMSRLLKSIYNSNILHKGNDNRFGSLVELTNDNITVFEDIMRYIYSLSNLPYFIDENVDTQPEILDFSIKKIRKMTLIDNADGDGAEGFNTNWEEEIDSFIGFIDECRTDLYGSETSGNLNAASIDPNMFSPDTAAKLMYAINETDLVHDALPVFLRKTFETMGLNPFVTYDSKVKANFELNQNDFATRKRIDRDESVTGEISLIKGVLKNLIDDREVEATYFDFSDITTFVGNEGMGEKKFDGLLDFISHSKILANTFEMSTHIVDARSLFLFNLFKDIDYKDGKMTSLFVGDDMGTKLVGIKKYFELSTYNHLAESAALFNLISSTDIIDSISTSITSDITKLGEQADNIELLLKYSYDAYGDNTESRSYFVSQMLSSIFNDVIQEELKYDRAVPDPAVPRGDIINYKMRPYNIYDIEETTFETEVIDDVSKTKYIPLSKEECLGIIASFKTEFSILKVGECLLNPSLEKRSAQDLRDSFSQMNGSTIAKIVYVAEIDMTLYLAGLTLPLPIIFGGFDTPCNTRANYYSTIFTELCDFEAIGNSFVQELLNASLLVA